MFLRAHGLPESGTGQFIDTFIAEWNAGVTYADRVVAAVRSLSTKYRIGVVTNTHLPWLVPLHIEAMGLTANIPAVVTSIEIGHRKPHRKIFEAALRRVGSKADETVFIGDSLEADYAGATRAGLRAILVDPVAAHAFTPRQRVTSVAEIPQLLARLSVV